MNPAAATVGGLLDSGSRAWWRLVGRISATEKSGPSSAAMARGRVSVARVPLHETFHVYVDDEGVLRTDHVLDLWGARVLQLHYRLTRV